MFDIADKEDLIQKIKEEVGGSYIGKSSCTNEISREIIDEIEYDIRVAIDNQIEKVIRSIITHLYTHSEFEKDVGIIE